MGRADAVRRTIRRLGDLRGEAPHRGRSRCVGFGRRVAAAPCAGLPDCVGSSGSFPLHRGDALTEPGSKSVTRASAALDARQHRTAAVGSALAVLAGLSGAVGAVAVSRASGVVPATELLFVRSVLAMAVLAVPAWPYLHLVRSRTGVGLAVLSVSGALGIVCYFTNLQLIAAGTAKALTSLSLGFVVLFSAVFLHEWPTARTSIGIGLMALALAVLGLDAEAMPGPLPLTLAVLGGAFAATAYVALRAIASESPPALTVFVLSVATGLIIPLLPSQEWVALTSGRAVGLVAVVAVSGTAANLLIAQASRFVQAGLVNALGKSDLVWVVALAGFLFGEWPRAAEWGAYALAFAAVLVLQRVRIAWRPTVVSVAVPTAKAIPHALPHQLEAAIEAAEALTSCEFVVHLDAARASAPRRHVRALFRDLGVGRTELRNGVLVAYFAAAGRLVVAFDRGIAQALPAPLLRSGAREIGEEIARSGGVEGVGHGLTRLAGHFAEGFPRAVDDVDELPNTVSVVAG